MTRPGLFLVLIFTGGLALAAQQAIPGFEVASVKRNTSIDTGDHSALEPGGRVVLTNMTLDNMIRGVFQVQRHELIVGAGVPSWFTSERWDIAAVGPPAADEASQHLVRVMVQNLLIDRFKLVTRREVRDTPVYALVVARADRRLGTQMKPSSADCAAMLAAFRATGERQTPLSPVCGRNFMTGRIRGIGIPVAELVRALIPVAGRPVTDATGLTGSFDIDLSWAPDGASEPRDGASLFTAVQEQLGLRLEPRQAPLNVLVVESAQRPEPD